VRPGGEIPDFVHLSLSVTLLECAVG
jgi:hypothetical protein